jgi:hypothetical protein
MSDPKLIAKWIADAAKLADGVPTDLREAAFRAAFDSLARGGDDSPVTVTRVAKSHRRTPAAGAAEPRPIARRTTRSGGRIGPKAVIAVLIDEGYFSEPRTLAAIREHLSSNKGRRIEAKHVATSVLRLLRDGRLARARGTDGEYEYRSAV